MRGLFKLIRPYISLTLIHNIERYALDTKFFNYLYKEGLKRRITTIEARRLPPHVVYIENTNACNAKCVMCPRDDMTRKSGFMDLGLYKKIIDECASWGVKEVHLQNFGEPLLDSTFPERVKYAKSRSLKTVVFTNGSLLKDKMAEDVLRAGLDEIVISADTADKKTFEMIRKGLSYEEVLGNIKAFKEKRDRLGYKKPKIICALTHSAQDAKNMRQSRRFWTGIADAVVEKHAHDWAGAKKDFLMKHKFKYFWPCVFLWNTMTVLWNGQVTTCCEDFDGKVNFGNATDQRMNDIFWNNKIKEYRELHKHGRRKEILLCGRCPLNLLWTI